MRRATLALIADAALVALFAAIGFATHNEDAVTPWAVWMTAWPFLAALAVGWVVTLAWRDPLAPARTGIPLWIITVAGGMLLRFLTGQGTALPFVIVATLTLALLLIGWRVASTLIGRARSRRPAA